jgi:hypothetical protein
MAAYKPTYKTEFPEFGELDVAIPEGFEDVSWHNDAMPSFALPKGDGTYLRLWVDYKDREMSDINHEPYFRFALSHSDAEMMFISDVAFDNDFSNILTAIDEWKAANMAPSTRPRPR